MITKQTIASFIKNSKSFICTTKTFHRGQKISKLENIFKINLLIQLVGSESEHVSRYRHLACFTWITANFGRRAARSLGCFNKLLTAFLGIIKKQLPKELKIWNHEYSPKCWISYFFIWIQDYVSCNSISNQKYEQNKYEGQWMNSLKQE